MDQSGPICLGVWTVVAGDNDQQGAFVCHVISAYHLTRGAFQFKMLQIFADVHDLEFTRNLCNCLRICGFFVGEDIWEDACFGVTLHKQWISLLYQLESIVLQRLMTWLDNVRWRKL
jgi:hypothetical protein